MAYVRAVLALAFVLCFVLLLSAQGNRQAWLHPPPRPDGFLDPRTPAARASAPVPRQWTPDGHFDPLGLHPREPRAITSDDDAALWRDWRVHATALTIAAGVPSPAAASVADQATVVFKGQIGSMLHPIIMASLFLVSLWAAYTGYCWRRLRTIGADIKQYKDELNALKAAANVPVPAGQDEPVSKPVHTPRMLELEEKINTMSEERKSLAEGSFRDKHFAMGSFLLASGVSFAIEGPVNTYLRAGKLFPGEHLYAGAAIVVLWALAAAMIPWMQKGKEWARTTHISLNVLNIALFAYYQIPSGYKIALKVLEKTKFPW